MYPLLAVIALAGPGPANPPQFEVHTTAGKLLVGAVRSLTDDGTLLVQDQGPVAGSDLVALRRLATPLPSWPMGGQIVLHNGDRLAGAPMELTGALLRFQAAGLQRNADDNEGAAIRVPLTAISYLWLRSPETIDRERSAAFLAESRANDMALLRNGDIIAGTLTALDAPKGELVIDSGEKRRTIALSRVTALAVSTKTARVRKPMGRHGHLVLANGSRITATNVAINDGVLEATTLFRERIRMPLAEVSALDIYQGKAVYLSDLKPCKYEYRTYQGEEFNWAADRNLEGGELRLRTPIGVQTYDKGVAVHGECRITYALDHAYKRFESVVGLDAKLGARGSAELLVLVDGKEHRLRDGKPVTLESGPVYVQMDIKGAKELTLVVKWGDGGNVGDYVNWCDARLVP